MKISILTISFNQDSFLSRCVESVRGQSYDRWEHIIADPGSSDSSREIINRAATVDPRVAPLFASDNGPADGLNNCLEAASGDLIMYINADDELAPGALDAVVDAHARRPDVDIVFADGWIIDSNGTPIKFVRSDKFTPSRYARDVGTVLQQATSFKSTIFDRGLRFNPANRINWDTELLFDAVAMGASSVNDHAVVGYFRAQPDSLTVSGRLADLQKAESMRLKQAASFSSANRALSFPSRVAKKLASAVRGTPEFPGLV